MAATIETNLSYFEVVEEHFQIARGSGFFRLSTLDWALVEAWQREGVPLEAVLRGIDRTFTNWHAQPARARTQRVNSLAYCAQEVVKEAQAIKCRTQSRQAFESQFSVDAVRAFVARNAEAVRRTGFPDLAEHFESLDIIHLHQDIEQLEHELNATEQKLIARLHASASAQYLSAAQRALDSDLNPYRGKLNAGQLETLQKQFLERRLMETSGVPRLSLFYL
jgi:hypothetical protein